MKAVIVGNGGMKPEAHWKEYIQKFDLIVAADGGIKFLHAIGITPHVLLGDFDSIPKELLDYYGGLSIKLLRYPKEKDYTDTWLAMDYCVEQKAEELILLNVTGDRLDHMLGVIYLLRRFLKKGVAAKILDETNEISLLEGNHTIFGKPGGVLSLLPHGGDAFVSTSGLKWDLNDTLMTYDDPIGISNEFLAEIAEIHVKKGQLLLIKNRTPFLPVE